MAGFLCLHPQMVGNTGSERVSICWNIEKRDSQVSFCNIYSPLWATIFNVPSCFCKNRLPRYSGRWPFWCSILTTPRADKFPWSCVKVMPFTMHSPLSYAYTLSKHSVFVDMNTNIYSLCTCKKTKNDSHTHILSQECSFLIRPTDVNSMLYCGRFYVHLLAGILLYLMIYLYNGQYTLLYKTLWSNWQLIQARPRVMTSSPSSRTW